MTSSIILLWLTPNDFTRQSGRLGGETVNINWASQASKADYVECAKKLN